MHLIPFLTDEEFEILMEILLEFATDYKEPQHAFRLITKIHNGTIKREDLK